MKYFWIIVSLIVYYAMIKSFTDQTSQFCGIFYYVPPLLFLYIKYIYAPNQEKIAEADKRQKEQERIIGEKYIQENLQQADYSTLLENNFKCSFCGGEDGVLAVDSKTFQKSKSIVAKRISICTKCQLDKITPKDFEIMVGNAFSRRGYKVQHNGKTGDGGVDLICTRGEEKIIVQCKHYKTTVGIAFIRDFYGALLHSNATKGYFITTGEFPTSAYQWVKGKPIELISKRALTQFLLNKP